MRAADARGFTYALEPERHRRQWQLQAAMARLGDLRRRLGDLVSARERLGNECVAQAAQAGRVWALRADPGAQARLLRYIATLQQRQAEAQGQITALTDLLQIARAECLKRQQALDVLDRHRQDALKIHAIECHRKNAAAADHDWSARNGYQSRIAEAP